MADKSSSGFSSPGSSEPGFAAAFGTLQQIAGARRSTPRSEESCELCSAALGREHPHLLEPESRQIYCACGACALLFDGIPKSRYKRIPRDARYLQDFEMTDAQWENLRIPIVPMRLDGVWRMKRQRRRFAHPGEITVHIGAPVSFPAGAVPEEIASLLEILIKSL